MIRLLAKIFIPDRENCHSPAVRQAYGTLCGAVGLFWNLILFAGKYFAGVISGSVAITADAFNNLTDAGSSVINLIGFALAGRKPDTDHPFGHGRMEYLAGLALSFLILLTGVELAKSSVDKILHPQPVESGLLPALILVASICVKLYMSFYNRAVGKKIDSPSMKATSIDSLSDAVSTLVVLGSMLISQFSGVNIDGFAGLAVAIFILFAGYNALKDTISPLLGQAPDPQLVHRIEEIVLAHPEVVGIHDMLIHDYGPGRLMVSLHAEVKGDGDIFALHDAVDSAENEVRTQLGCLTATIHMDPVEADNTEVSNMRHALSETVKRIDARLTIHDLRIVPGPTHTNLIFDVVMPHDCKLTDEELTESIRSLVSSTWENHYAVITVDRDYCR